MAHSYVRQFTLLLSLSLLPVSLPAQPHVVSANQGTTMRLQLDNRGAFGRISHLVNPPPDSIGLEFPPGSGAEHLEGAGIWVAGLIDTSVAGTGQKVPLVSTSYEGYAGPLFEFFPGNHAADSIWKVYGRGATKPPGWDAYWGSSLEFRPVADQNFYCMYTDYNVPISQHIPLRLKIIQSSFTWDSTAYEGIQIFRHRIINTGTRTIDSCYIGIFADPVCCPANPWGGAYYFSGYFPDARLGYAVKKTTGATPFGVSLLDPASSSQLTFYKYPAPLSPNSDRSRYAMMSSGLVSPDEFPPLVDTRFVLALGPYTVHPSDTLSFATAVVAAYTLQGLHAAALTAKDLYNSRVLSAEGADVRLPLSIQLYQNYPNPFNPATTIRYRVQEHGHVTLNVFDVLGREVATLVDEVQNPGEHAVEFNADGLSSGVYFYRLSTQGFTAVKKMLVVR